MCVGVCVRVCVRVCVCDCFEEARGSGMLKGGGLGSYDLCLWSWLPSKSRV